jgi:serine/threonine protein kinase
MTIDSMDNSTGSNATPFAVADDSNLSGEDISSNQTAKDSDLATRIKPPKVGHITTESRNDSETVGVGTILKGRFIIDMEIARGGMGVVYRARDNLKEQFQDRNPYLAIKVLGEECKAHPDFLIALQREAGKAQKLAHPNIVTVYDFDTDGDNVFMTMEYLEGESLQRFLYRRGEIRLPTERALELITAMGQGLAYAHQKGIVHCDFKPGNVFLTDDDVVKILDFGIARADKRPEQFQQDATRFDAGRLGALTPTYASCELLENADPDPRDDIYGLACVAYELLTGRHPFNRLPADVARDSNLKPAPIKELTKKQWKALRQGLAFERASRPASVTQFLADLTSRKKAAGIPLSRQVIVSFGLLALSVVVVGYSIQDSDNQTKPVERTSASSMPQKSHTPVTLSAEQQKKVERLLEAAEIHFMVKRITEPVGSNAYEAYKHVLEIDPTNVKARAGLKQIADYYENLARKSLANGDHKATLSSIERGLDVMPKHAGLNELKEKMVHKSPSSRFTGWLKTFWQ